MVQCRLKGRHSVSFLHLDGGSNRNLAARVPDPFPDGSGKVCAMDVFIVRTHEPGAVQINQLSRNLCAGGVRNNRHTGLAAGFPDLGIDGSVQSKRQQLVIRREVLRAEPDDVLRISVRRALPRGVAEDRPASGFLEAGNAGVAVSRRMRDLRKINGRGNARAHLANRSQQLSNVGIIWLIVGIQRAGIVNDTVIVILEQSIRDEASQDGLILMMMRVHEARHHDSVGRVDNFRSGLQIGPHRGNFLSLNQHIGVLKVANITVHAEYDAAFEQDTAPSRAASGGNSLTLWQRGLRQRLCSSDCPGNNAERAGFQETAARHPAARAYVAILYLRMFAHGCTLSKNQSVGISFPRPLAFA